MHADMHAGDVPLGKAKKDKDRSVPAASAPKGKQAKGKAKGKAPLQPITKKRRFPQLYDDGDA